MERRKKGDGSFTRKSNGTISYRIDYGYDELTGKRIRKTFTGKTEKECRKKARDYEKGLENQEIVYTTRTLGEWLMEWLEVYKEKSVSPATYSNYLFNAKIICADSLAQFELIDIKPIHIQKFYQRNHQYSKSVLDKLRFLLQAAFESAIDNDLCYKNPAKHVLLPPKKTHEKNPFSEQEIKTIIKYAPYDSFGFAIIILLMTGLRSGELRALLTTDIDLTNRIITINKAINRDQQIALPKNKKSRHVPISNELYQWLIKSVRPGTYVLGGNTFLTKDGFESRYKTFFRHLNQWCEENHLEPVVYKPPHTTRHTYASILVKQNIHMKIIQIILGHSDIEMSAHYSHADLETLRQAVSNLKMA